jgi:hypothetical protein
MFRIMKSGMRIAQASKDEVPQCRLQQFALQLFGGNGRVLSVTMWPPLNSIMRR